MHDFIIWWLNPKESSYFKENPELTFAALKFYIEYEEKCVKAEKSLKTKVKKLINEFELKQGLKM